MSNGWFDKGRNEPLDPPFVHGSLDHEIDYGRKFLEEVLYGSARGTAFTADGDDAVTVEH